MIRFCLCFLLLIPAQLLYAQTASNDSLPGKAVYDRVCAACHDNPEQTRSPSLDTLRGMPFQAIHYALNLGKMQVQASGLSEAEKNSVIEFLVGGATQNDAWESAMQCQGARKGIDFANAATVSTFGFDLGNNRYLSAAQSGLTGVDVADLELAWAIGFPKATTMRSQPAVVGNTLFLPVADSNAVYAIDTGDAHQNQAPCLEWVYKSDIPMRTSAAYGQLSNGRRIIVVGDLGAFVHAIDANTGELIWKAHIGLYEHSLATGTPVIYQDRVYAPVSQFEISVAGNESHLCCKSHGAITALDANTGASLWTTHTMPEAKPIRDRGDGQMIWGPSGAPIWNSPAIDRERGLLFFGTGEATSEPAHPNTDAIIALDIKDGSIRWSFQATANDIFITGCGRQRSLNCPKENETVYRDVDFGASMMLAKAKDGTDLVIAGQKSGSLWALNRDTGKVIWRQDFGEGSPLGGIHWGIAADGTQVYAPINRPYARPVQDQNQHPGLHAVNISDGRVIWTYQAQPDCSGDRQQRFSACARNIGFSGAPSVVDTAVIAGSLDGYLRAFDRGTGKVLFEFDTIKSFSTVNNIEARGGSIDNASIVAANGYVFVSSGYGMFGQQAGNVFLAFKKKAKQN